MAEANQEKKADCTYVQSVPWHQNDLIARNISTFLGPTDLCSFRLVCKKWKEESSSIWKYLLTRHILRRYSECGVKSTKGLHDPLAQKPDPKPLTVFSEYRPQEMECNFDCVWAEELRDFFARATKGDAKLMDTSFLVIKLKKWNRFGNFSSGEQEGAKWFLNEVTDKVVHLTLDKCNLSISQNEFFPTLCRMTQLKEMVSRRTCFQLRPSVPVQPTLTEITPLPKLAVVEMNYGNSSVKRMPNYNFPWEIFLGACQESLDVYFSFSDRTSLNFAIHQFSKMIMVPSSVELIIFKNLSEPNQESMIPKDKVMEIVQESMKKLNIEISMFQNFQQRITPTFPLLSIYNIDGFGAFVQDRLIGIRFDDHVDRSKKINFRNVQEIFEEVNRLRNEN